MKQSLPDWDGLDAYIIGGGPSLRQFDFTLLEGKRTIGCNHAFRLGVDICQICCFADTDPFFNEASEELKIYAANGGIVVTNHHDVPEEDTSWLHKFPRVKHGLSHDGLGYNANTGAVAINLALWMGATTVYLLGFDMSGQGNRNNWHEHGTAAREQELYQRHLDGMKNVHAELGKFPDARVVQLVTEGAGMELFPPVILESHFGGVCAQV